MATRYKGDKLRFSWIISEEMEKKLSLIAEREQRSIAKQLRYITTNFIEKYEYTNALSFENDKYISKLK